MATRTTLAVVLNGLVQNQDLTADELVLDSVKVGGGAGTALTKTILDKLVNLQNGSDFANGTNSHTHDGRYFTETELGSATGTTGSDRIGDDNTYSNFTPAAATVKGALSGIDAALAATADEKVAISAADTTPGYLDDKIVAGAGLSSAIVNPAGDEDLSLSVNVDGSTLEINSDALRVKDGGITNAKVAAGIDAVKIGAGAVSNTEFGYLDGVTSAIQTQFTGKQSTSEKGQANGYASLDGAGKVPVAQLPNSIMEYQGMWNASTNSPTLADGVGSTGDVYRVSTAGSQNLGSGSISFAVGDYVIYNGSTWEKADTTDSVVSVNGFTGVVVLSTSDIAEGSNLYFSDERAQDAIGTILLDSATIDFTYNDGTPSITAIVKTNSIDESHLTTSVAGAGLAGGNGTALSVNVDGSTLEINSDTLRIKDAGVTLAKMASLSVDENKLTASVAGDGLTGGAGSPLAVGAGTGLSVTANAVNVDFAPMVKKTQIAGESMTATFSYLVRFAVTGETAGRIYKATNAAGATDGKFWAHGLALSAGAIAIGDPTSVTVMGTHTLGAGDTPFASGDVGKPVWLTTAGGFSISPPSSAGTAAYKVGVVEDTNKIWMGDKQLTGIN